MFAWSHEDIPRIDPNVMVHRLNVNPNFKIVIQKRRSFNPERCLAISKDVDKLLDTDFIKEAYYSEWLANVVQVKRHTGI